MLHFTKANEGCHLNSWKQKVKTYHLLTNTQQLQHAFDTDSVLVAYPRISVKYQLQVDENLKILKCCLCQCTALVYKHTSNHSSIDFSLHRNDILVSAEEAGHIGVQRFTNEIMLVSQCCIHHYKLCGCSVHERKQAQ